MQDVFDTVVAVFIPLGNVVWRASQSPSVLSATLPAEGELSVSFPDGSSDEDERDSNSQPRLTRKEEKALEKEVPWERIPLAQRPAYIEARVKEWTEWQKWKAVRPLSAAESAIIEADPEKSKRILPSRF